MDAKERACRLVLDCLHDLVWHAQVPKIDGVVYRKPVLYIVGQEAAVRQRARLAAFVA